jgi:hypothetical protein
MEKSRQPAETGAKAAEGWAKGVRLAVELRKLKFSEVAGGSSGVDICSRRIICF